MTRAPGPQHGDGDDLNPWLELPETPPYVAPRDREFLHGPIAGRANLKLNHPPVPWLGDPRRARVVLLNLNPGWAPSTDELEGDAYAAENRLCLTFRSRVPFFSLDDQFAGTPAHCWWSRRLRWLIARVGSQQVQSELACVEWFPYHSAAFTRLPSYLPSQRYGFRLVQAAVERGSVIVIMRSRRLWYEAVPLLATADPVELRSPQAAYLSPRNAGQDGFERICSALGSKV